MLLLYLPADADEKAAEETWDAFMAALAQNAEGYVASASGWVVEELEHENVGGKARGFQAAIGWTGVEAHMKYRETEGFKEGIQVVRGVFKGSAMVSFAGSFSLLSFFLSFFGSCLLVCLLFGLFADVCVASY
jgi:hypothetical protein